MVVCPYYYRCYTSAANSSWHVLGDGTHLPGGRLCGAIWVTLGLNSTFNVIFSAAQTPVAAHVPDGCLVTDFYGLFPGFYWTSEVFIAAVWRGSLTLLYILLANLFSVLWERHRPVTVVSYHTVVHIMTAFATCGFEQ